jgi:putative PIG3 family NAD(P)H quinone oxidoreductase
MAEPKTMRAIAISEPGGPEVLVLEDRPIPVPSEGEILIAVAAAGVNRPDVMQRKGHYPPPPGAPDIPGLEVSGVVARLGRGVERWKEGDQVVALVPGGGYAEYCTVHGTNALPLPELLTFAESAGLPETTFTVWQNVFQRGALRRGEWLLVHGGTSGIGTTAIQLAKAFGAFVVTTAGSDEKCRAARRLGADVAINYRTTDFVEAVREATRGHGADVILDMVGGDYLDRNTTAAAEEGRIVQISTLAGPKTTVDLRKIMQKRLILTGSTLRPRPVEFKAELARSIEEAVWPVIAQGRYKPVIDRLYPLDEVVEAHRRIDGGEHIGKIILTMTD